MTHNKQACAVLSIIDTALALMPKSYSTPASRTMLLAISGQEATWKDRAQKLNNGGKGPARGLWQFEQGGGVVGVMTHASSKKEAARICALRGVQFNKTDVWRELEYDDVLAACFARLLLLTDPRALPAPTMANAKAAWDTYYRNWRPGKPHPNKWDGLWKIAIATVELDS